LIVETSHRCSGENLDGRDDIATFRRVMRELVDIHLDDGSRLVFPARTASTTSQIASITTYG